MSDLKPHVLGAATLHPRVDALWLAGLPGGEKTGWPSVDRHYGVAPGQLTIITGWPGSGKSEWLDALLVNLMHQGWYTAFFSPENRPVELHVAKLLEKISGKPFGAGPTARLTLAEVQEYIVGVVASRFSWIEPADEETALSAAGVIEAATPWFDSRAGQKRALVIDPWNELEHWRPHGLSETEYVSKTLSTIRNWARLKGVHVFLVAHPQKMRRDTATGKLPVPTLDMISGSQHWWNKADAGITVYFDPETDGQEVEIHIQKVRFKHIGRRGLVTLRYDKVSGRYHEIPNLQAVRNYANKGDDD